MIITNSNVEFCDSCGESEYQEDLNKRYIVITIPPLIEDAYGTFSLCYKCKEELAQKLR